MLTNLPAETAFVALIWIIAPSRGRILTAGPVFVVPAREQEVAGLPVEGYQVLIEDIAGLLAQFEPDGTTGFPLPDTGASDRSAMRSDILDFDTDHVTAAGLAVDSEIEHGEVSDGPIDLELLADQPDMLDEQWRLSD